MEKVIRDENVAVLVSKGYGAGFYSLNSSHEILLFSPKIVEMVEQGKAELITSEWIKENLGIEGVYCGGAEDLKIHWIPIGSRFEINDFDGNERLITIDDLPFIA